MSRPEEFGAGAGVRLRRGIGGLTVLLLATTLLTAPGALAAGSAYSRVEGIYSVTGQIPSCRFSIATLDAALSQAPTYDAEYLAAFGDAVQSTIAQQASGACKSGGGHRRLSGVSLGPGYGSPALPAGIESGTASGMPITLALLLIAAALGLLGVAFAGVGRLLGLDPLWAQAARHGLAETEYRIDDLLDRLLGRFNKGS